MSLGRPTSRSFELLHATAICRRSLARTFPWRNSQNKKNLFLMADLGRCWIWGSTKQNMYFHLSIVAPFLSELFKRQPWKNHSSSILKLISVDFEGMCGVSISSLIHQTLKGMSCKSSKNTCMQSFGIEG